MKNILVILLFVVIAGCSIKPTVINYKMDKLAYDYIASDVVILLKNIYSPAKTKLVYYSNTNKKFVESIENNLRAAGYSIRDIKNEQASIFNEEISINFIIDKVNETYEEKRIKKINNDKSNTIRLSVMIDKKMYSRLYKIYKTYEITPISRWIETNIVQGQIYEQ